MKTNKIIFHIDINAFFASVEEIKNPELKNKPIIVGSRTEKGIATTANYEARKYGIKAGMPNFLAKQLCPQVIMIESDYEAYSFYSEKFFNLIQRKVSNKFEIGSVDECYIDMTEIINKYNPLKVAEKLQKMIKAELNLDVSIGISYNKELAKIASNIKKPKGITLINKNNIDYWFSKLDIGSISGIGKKSLPFFQDLGINKIIDLRKEKDNLKGIQEFGKSWSYFINISFGNGNNKINYYYDKLTSISHAKTFYHSIEDYNELVLWIERLSYEVSMRCKINQLVGNSINIKLKNGLKSISKQRTLKNFDNSFNFVYENSIFLLDSLNHDKINAKLISIGIGNLIPIKNKADQIDIFDTKNIERDDIQKIIHDVNKIQNYKDTVFKASELENKERKIKRKYIEKTKFSNK